MPKNPQTVLAINPGTRYLGMAVFSSYQLKDWRIKVLRGLWVKEKLPKALQIVAEWIEKYQPETLVLKELHPSRSSRHLETLTAKIQQLGHRQEMTVRQYTVKQLEAYLCGEERRNKHNLAQAIVAQYPELYPELICERTLKNHYHMRMLEAVALGIMGIDDAE